MLIVTPSVVAVVVVANVEVAAVARTVRVD